MLGSALAFGLAALGAPVWLAFALVAVAYAISGVLVLRALKKPTAPADPQ